MTNSKPQGSALYTSLETGCHVNCLGVAPFFPPNFFFFEALQSLNPLLSAGELDQTSSTVSGGCSVSASSSLA